jgi:hypothetical protein
MCDGYVVAESSWGPLLGREAYDVWVQQHTRLVGGNFEKASCFVQHIFREHSRHAGQICREGRNL